MTDDARRDSAGDRIRSYRDLKVWQRAVDLAAEVRDLLDRMPREDFGRRGQMMRAALSVSDNIAEGHGRAHLGDYLRHLSIANGSLEELESQVISAERIRLLSSDATGPCLHRIAQVGGMLGALIRTLRARYRP